MSFFDLLSMSLGNLWRRKLRTFLTVLGVLIGTASIVGMLSMALGMQKLIMDEYSGMGSVTLITVNSGGSEGSAGGGSGKLNTDTLLTDSNVEMFQSMDHVESVDPYLNMSVNMKQGKYDGYTTVTGVSKSILEKQEVAQGELPKEGGSSIQVLAGNNVITSFSYSSGDNYYDYYSTGELPPIDLMKQLKQVSFYDEYAMSDNDTTTNDTGDVSSGDGSADGTDSTDGTGDGTGIDDGSSGSNMTSQDDGSVKLNVNVTGIISGGPDDYTEYSGYLLADMDAMKAYLTKTFGKGKLPGQPKNNGRPLKEWVYSNVGINVDKTENVNDVMQSIQDMGFEASSNKELLDSAQQTVRIIELVLGGIGMVAFLVAAIGIANTMMMSTYERTKEIGIMKVLGCDMRNIQNLFLAEAGFIGFIGGVIGLGFTMILSAIINNVALQSGQVSGNVSLITWWLAVIAIVFSTVMGMIAGFFPARRAMKLSPLAAIRNE